MLDLATEGEDNEDDDTDNATCVHDVDKYCCFDCCTRIFFVCLMDDIYGLIPPLPSPLFLLTASLPCCSYCCACSVIDSLARKAPPRIMWPLVKDFIASKVPLHRTTKAPATFPPTILSCAGCFCRRVRPTRRACSPALNRRGFDGIHEAKRRGLGTCVAAQSLAYRIFVTVRQVRCALQGLADPDPRVVNEGAPKPNRNQTKNCNSNFCRRTHLHWRARRKLGS
jgi:hypothetical protein